MKKSNRVICLTGIDFYLRETDNLFDENKENNNNLDDDRNRIYLNRKKLNFKRKGESSIPNLYSFLFMLSFKLKLDSTPIFKFYIFAIKFLKSKYWIIKDLICIRACYS